MFPQWITLNQGNGGSEIRGPFMPEGSHEGGDQRIFPVIQFRSDLEHLFARLGVMIREIPQDSTDRHFRHAGFLRN